MKLKKDGTISKQGENGGRPPKYDDGEVLRAKASDYFRLCDDTHQKPEKAGLCLFLGIDKSTYNDYKKKFPHVLKSMELFIESAWVRRLDGQAAVGAIFYLKNAFREDYKDKTETDMTLRTPKPLLDALFNNPSDKKDSGTKE